MKTLFCALFALGLSAQTTTVTQVVKDGANHLVTGSCIYALASGRALTPSGDQVTGEPVTVLFINGAFSAAIVPTDTMLPATQSYTVKCIGTRGWSKSGTWIVPTSGSAVHWDDIWASAVPTPPVTILRSQISASGLTNGTQYCIVPVSGVVTFVACSGVSGSAPATWSAMTGAWSSYTGAWSTYH